MTTGVPEPLKSHFMLSPEPTYEAAVTKITQYLRMKKVTSKNKKRDPDAMDVDALWEGKNGRGGR